MYIIMCVIRSHTNYGQPDDKVEITNIHPADCVKTRKEAREWMNNIHLTMLPHLNGMGEEVWERGTFNDKTHMQLLNKDKTIERMYVLVRA